jgi:hypothetical protein
MIMRFLFKSIVFLQQLFCGPSYSRLYPGGLGILQLAVRVQVLNK